MTIGRAFAFPNELRLLRERVRSLSWLSIVLLSSAATLLFLTLGQSQAMKTAWVGDMLTLVPPAAMLLAMRVEQREPTKRFPFGYTRAVVLAFLVTSGVLSITGLYLLYDAMRKLLGQERPPIGSRRSRGGRGQRGPRRRLETARYRRYAGFETFERHTAQGRPVMPGAPPSWRRQRVTARPPEDVAAHRPRRPARSRRRDRPRTGGRPRRNSWRPECPGDVASPPG
jgi:hypothetical protein